MVWCRAGLYPRLAQPGLYSRVPVAFVWVWSAGSRFLGEEEEGESQGDDPPGGPALLWLLPGKELCPLVPHAEEGERAESPDLLWYLPPGQGGSFWRCRGEG